MVLELMVYLYCRMPDHVTNVSCGIRSFFPGSINCGYYSSFKTPGPIPCYGSSESFTCGVLCQTGELTFTFMYSGLDALQFGKSLQMTVKRKNTSVKYVADKPSSIGYEKGDLDLMPLMHGEHILGKVEGTPQAVPFLGNDSVAGRLTKFICSCNSGDNSYLCSAETMGRYLFPCLPRCLTCGYLPVYLKKDMVVTDYSLITYVRKSRSCLFSCCDSVSDFGVVWFSNEMLLGHTLTIDNKGHENCYSRLCKGMMCGRMCCPIGTNTYRFVVQMDKLMQFSIEHTDVNKNWLTDESQMKNIRLMDNVQNAQYHSHKDHKHHAAAAGDHPAPEKAHHGHKDSPNKTALEMERN